MSALGFHVWNPAGRLPTCVHPTFLAAVAEADRLKRAYPAERFVVMSPVEDMSGVGYALGWSRGREEGLAQAHSEIMKAEGNADRWGDEVVELRKKLKRLQAVSDRAAPFQAIVADCLLWFDGFAAAHSPKEAWERPHVPNRERLRQLNEALQALLPDGLKPEFEADLEIPF